MKNADIDNKNNKITFMQLRLPHGFPHGMNFK